MAQSAESASICKRLVNNICSLKCEDTSIMKKSHLNFYFPQWQGGGQDLSTYKGGQELRLNYLQKLDLAEVEVSTKNVSKAKNGIIGYDEIFAQLSQANLLITDKNPSTIFTVGGGCDADIISISHLNKVTEGDMTLLYFDAHGDINTPQSSNSKFFYGMLVRALLGDGEKTIVDLLPSMLLPSQLIMLGIRDLDKAESEYIKEQKIVALTPDAIEKDMESVIQKAKAKCHQNIYIHIDLDVLDQAEFPHVPLPTSGGLKNDTLLYILRKLHKEFTIVGLGLFEYSPTAGKDNNLLQEIVKIGSGL